MASLILFQGFNTTSGMTTLLLLVGFIITFLGVHLLDFSRKAQDVAQVETGTVDPRCSMGRMNTDGGWHVSGGMGDSESATLFGTYVGNVADAGFPLTWLGMHEEDEGHAVMVVTTGHITPSRRRRPGTRLVWAHRLGRVRATLRRGHSYTKILQDRGEPNRCDTLTQW